MDKFRVVGLRRSGNHAIILWLSYHFEKERVLFLNNINPNERIFSYKNLKKYNHKLHLLQNHDPFVKIKLYKKYNNYDCLIYSHEDINLTELSEVEHKTIIIIRDPYNTTASRLEQLKINSSRWWFSVDDKYIDKVIQYLEECIGKTNIIKNKIILNL